MSTKITELTLQDTSEESYSRTDVNLIADVDGAAKRVSADDLLAETEENIDANARAITEINSLLNQGFVVSFTQAEDGTITFVYSDGTSESASAGGGSGTGFATVYYDTETGYLHFYDESGVDVVDAVYIGGGGSGSSSGSSLTFSITSGTSIAVADGATEVGVTVLFKSVDTVSDEATGSGTLQIYKDGVVVKTLTLAQGSTTIDFVSYVSTGSNSFKLVMTDSYGATATRSLTITMESLTLAWNLGNTEKNSGDLTVYLTPTGTGSKTVYLTVDGETYSADSVATSGRRLTKTITGLASGEHTLTAWAEMALDSATLTSDVLTCSVAQCNDGEDTTVVAAILSKSEVTQGDTVQVIYRVIDPENNPTTAYHMVNGGVYATVSVDQSEQTWSYKTSTSGEMALGILCGSTMKTLTLNVNALSDEISEVDDGLDVKLDPAAITDLASYSYNGYAVSLSDGFDTTNGGIQTDDEGIPCIKIIAGDRLTLSYQPFSVDARKAGMELKVVYKVENCTAYEAEAITCVNGGIGLTVRANDVSFTTEQTSSTLQTCEGQKTELDINVQPDSDDRSIIFWESCSPCEPSIYATGDNFVQSTAQSVVFGSDECDLLLYLFRGYNRGLTDEEIKANFEADGKNATEMLERHERNQIYDSTGTISPELVAELNPDLFVLTWHSDRLSLAKKEEVSGYLTCSHVAGGSTHTWTALDAIDKLQGTSSVGYAKDAGGNHDFNCANGFTLEDGTVMDTFSMSDGAIGVSYLNFKANTASQEHINNICISEWYNKYQPYIRAARAENANVRDCIEGHMAVLFFHNTSSSSVTIGPDTVGPDETVFYSLGCINNSKKNTDVFAQNEDDDIICIEVLNNTSDQGRMKSDDLSSEDFSGDYNFEFRYLDDSVTESEAKALFQEMLSFVVACDVTQATNTNLTTAVTYDGSTYLIDSEAYRRAKWKAEFADHFVVDSIFYHQLMTLQMTMVDNRCKNMFWGYSKAEGKWHLNFSYDHDTALGNDNEGGLTLRYGYLDTDTVGTRDVFNAADNTIFAMNREVFSSELTAEYLTLEAAGAFDMEAFADFCDEYQSYACESLWVEDFRRKNMRTYTEMGTSAYLPMAHGKKRLQRRNFCTFQRAFMSSYFQSSYCTSDSATIRGYTPSSYSGVEPGSWMTITSYCDIFINVRAGSIDTKVRAYAGEAVTVELGVASMNDTEIYVRNAGFMQDLGPLAQLYPGYFDASNLTRIKRSEVGSDADGYSNTNFTGASYTNCTALEYVNHMGCPNDNESMDFSPNVHLKELYTMGTSVTGVTFAKNGRVEIAQLNAVASLYMVGLYQLVSLTLEDYTKLTSLTLEDCPNLDSYTLTKAATALARVRLLEIAWVVPIAAYDVLLRLYNAAGIDDDGYNTDHGVVTGTCEFTTAILTKVEDISEKLTDVTFTYDSLLEEHTVTYVNDDGTVLYTYVTEHGGSAIDPVEEGYIPTPTKASDTDYDYTYWKWDTSLLYIVADTTVTALYSTTARVYTVAYTVNGETVETHQVTAHGSCSYEGSEPEASGYIFAGWEDYTSGTVDEVTEDMTIAAIMVYPTLPSSVKDLSEYTYAFSEDDDDASVSAYTRAEYAGIILAGYASTYLAVGDIIKILQIGDVVSDSYLLQRVEFFDHFQLADGSGDFAQVTFFPVGLLTASRVMNSTNTNVGGFPASAAYTWLNGDYLDGEFSPFIRNLMKQVVVLSSAGGESADIVSCNCYVTLPAAVELGFYTSDVPYKNEVDSGAANATSTLYTDAASRIRKTYNGEGTATNYWTRSPFSGGSTQFVGCSNYGGAYNYGAASSYGFAPGISM